MIGTALGLEVGSVCILLYIFFITVASVAGSCLEQAGAIMMDNTDQI